jgi:hypothetical protein
MAIDIKEFMEKTGAEVVGGRVIVGLQADRRYVGEVSDGKLSLSDEGKELLDKIEADQEAEKVVAAKEAKADKAK